MDADVNNGDLDVSDCSLLKKILQIYRIIKMFSHY